MSRRPTNAEVLLAEDRDPTVAIRATIYPNRRRYKGVRDKHFFEALDGAVRGMQAAKVPDPHRRSGSWGSQHRAGAE